MRKVDREAQQVERRLGKERRMATEKTEPDTLESIEAEIASAKAVFDFAASELLRLGTKRIEMSARNAAYHGGAVVTSPKVETPQEAQDRARAAGGTDKEAYAAWRVAKNAEIERKKNDPRYNTGTVSADEMARLNAERAVSVAEDRLRQANEQWVAAKVNQAGQS